MCGIVGYVGGRQAYPILVKGLTRLEYRGYDSAGVALVNDNGDLSSTKRRERSRTWRERPKARMYPVPWASPTPVGLRTASRAM